MKHLENLIDVLYRASFSKHTVSGWKSNRDMRRALESAQRFVVDEPMAAFMAELSNEAFIKMGVGNPLVLRIVDSLRLQARLPYESIWIEYPLRAYQRRAHEVRGTAPPIDAELPLREGWLIQQHPGIETACIMHLFTCSDVDDEHGFDTWTFPFAFAWCCDDGPLPWRTTIGDVKHVRDRFKSVSACIVGFMGYDRDNVSCVRSPLINDPSTNPKVFDAYAQLMQEWMGVIRRVWTLLATVDNLPLIKTETRTAKGFLGAGQIRKYLTRTTITLNVPAKTNTRVLARKTIAHAHRRRHRVRAHWRNDWRNPPASQCSHIWECVDERSADLIQCELCRGRQIYVHKHERGDGGVGYALHDYRITHS